jgi:hypothetical protein
MACGNPAGSWPNLNKARLDDRHRVRIRCHMDGLTFFGLFTAMLLSYALESRSHWFALAFAGACVLGSAYGFLQGAWPFGLVEAVWAGIAANRRRVRLMNAHGS